MTEESKDELPNAIGSEVVAVKETLSRLSESINKLDGKTETAMKAINDVKANLDSKAKSDAEPKADDKTINDIKKVGSVAVTFVNNLDKITSDDPIDNAVGIFNVIGSVAVAVGGPAGVIASSLCTLVAAILPLCGSKKPKQTMSKVVKEVIDEALYDYKQNEIKEDIEIDTNKMKNQLNFLTGLAAQGGVLKESEQSSLNKQEIYIEMGGEILSKLRVQIEANKSTDDHKRAKQIAKYIHSYCVISTMSRCILGLWCSLLKINEMGTILNAVKDTLSDYSAEHQLFTFMSGLNDVIDGGDVHEIKEKRGKHDTDLVLRYIMTNEVLTRQQQELIRVYTSRCFQDCDGKKCDCEDIKFMTYTDYWTDWYREKSSIKHDKTKKVTNGMGVKYDKHSGLPDANILSISGRSKQSVNQIALTLDKSVNGSKSCEFGGDEGNECKSIELDLEKGEFIEIVDVMKGSGTVFSSYDDYVGGFEFHTNLGRVITFGNWQKNSPKQQRRFGWRGHRLIDMAFMVDTHYKLIHKVKFHFVRWNSNYLLWTVEPSLEDKRKTYWHPYYRYHPSQYTPTKEMIFHTNYKGGQELSCRGIALEPEKM